MDASSIHLLDTPQHMTAVEELQRQVWPGDEIEIVPTHMLLAAAHNGGLVLGAFDNEQLVGFAFSFPGLYQTNNGPRIKHCSHMLGVLPAYRNTGVGFLLKRAQWQMVRHQGLDRITWTFDPLLSSNAHLNIARLGAICSTYLRDYYGELRDGLNAGLSTDRFQVDWWINSQRVERRLSKRPRLSLDLAHFLSGGIGILNPTHLDERGLPIPQPVSPEKLAVQDGGPEQPLMLVEIPADFRAMKATDPQLSQTWRLHTRQLFEALFGRGYLVTDFVHLSGPNPRSFYVLSHGEAELHGVKKLD
jgi:predicted GNAT superfamily acetyltransferase